MFVNWHVCVQVCVRTDFIRIYPKLLFTANVSSRFSYGSVQYKAKRYYGWWRLGEVRSALRVKFLSGITYALSELSHEKIDLYNPQKASLTKRTTKNSQNLTNSSLGLYKTATEIKIFFSRIVKLWRSLDSALKLKPSLKDFKRCLRKQFISKFPVLNTLVYFFYITLYLVLFICINTFFVSLSRPSFRRDYSYRIRRL